MILYHTTTLDAARLILSEGFRDGVGSYMFVGHVLFGVWLADEPIDGNEGAYGDVLLSVDVDGSWSVWATPDWR